MVVLLPCCVPAVAERDSALKQAESTARELSQLRDSSAALQQQLHVMTLEKQSQAGKSAKVALVSFFVRLVWETFYTPISCCYGRLSWSQNNNRTLHLPIIHCGDACDAGIVITAVSVHIASYNVSFKSCTHMAT